MVLPLRHRPWTRASARDPSTTCSVPPPVGKLVEHGLKKSRIPPTPPHQFIKPARVVIRHINGCQRWLHHAILDVFARDQLVDETIALLRQAARGRAHINHAHIVHATKHEFECGAAPDHAARNPRRHCLNAVAQPPPRMGIHPTHQPHQSTLLHPPAQARFQPAMIARQDQPAVASQERVDIDHTASMDASPTNRLSRDSNCGKGTNSHLLRPQRPETGSAGVETRVCPKRSSPFQGSRPCRSLQAGASGPQSVGPATPRARRRPAPTTTIKHTTAPLSFATGRSRTHAPRRQ